MELPNRDELEADFAKRFGKLARRHMLEFRELLGNPPDINNIPPEFWEKMEHEVAAETYAILLLIFDESAMLHGWENPGMAAYGWAKQRASDLANYWTDSSRVRLSNGLEELTNGEPPNESTVESARESNRFVPTNRITPYLPRTPESSEIDDLVDSVFGPQRVTGIAVDETTRARHAGGEAGIEETIGLSQDDVWRVNPPRVCKTCMELDGRRRADWPWRYREGPPIHPRCKCDVIYASVTLSDAIGRMLDDPDYKSLKSYDPNEKRDESGKWTSGGATSELHKQAEKMGTKLTPDGSRIIIEHPSVRKISNGRWAAVASPGDGSNRIEFAVKPTDEGEHSVLVTVYSPWKKEPYQYSSGVFETEDEAKKHLSNELQEAIDERTQLHRLSSKERRSGTLDKWDRVDTRFGHKFEPGDQNRYDDMGNYIGPEYGGETMSDLDEQKRTTHINKSYERFDLKSWYRQIPNAAEWRVYCRENGVPVNDRSEYAELFKKNDE